MSEACAAADRTAETPALHPDNRDRSPSPQSTTQENLSAPLDQNSADPPPLETPPANSPALSNPSSQGSEQQNPIQPAADPPAPPPLQSLQPKPGAPGPPLTGRKRSRSDMDSSAQDSQGEKESLPAIVENGEVVEENEELEEKKEEEAADEQVGPLRKKQASGPHQQPQQQQQQQQQAEPVIEVIDVEDLVSSDDEVEIIHVRAVSPRRRDEEAVRSNYRQFLAGMPDWSRLNLPAAAPADPQGGAQRSEFEPLEESYSGADAAVDYFQRMSGPPSTQTSSSPPSPLTTAESKKPSLNLECGICQEPISDMATTLCGHVYCYNCLSQSVRNLGRCPTCRKKLTVRQIHRVYL